MIPPTVTAMRVMPLMCVMRLMERPTVVGSTVQTLPQRVMLAVQPFTQFVFLVMRVSTMLRQNGMPMFTNRNMTAFPQCCTQHPGHMTQPQDSAPSFTTGFRFSNNPMPINIVRFVVVVSAYFPSRATMPRGSRTQSHACKISVTLNSTTAKTIVVSELSDCGRSRVMRISFWS